jgi:hypothetical protein
MPFVGFSKKADYKLQKKELLPQQMRKKLILI